MSSSSKLACALLACALLTEGAVAQSAAVPNPQSPTAKSIPAQPASSTVGFQSAFSRYRPYRAMPVSSWREINQRVAEIGGWKTYARQASAAEEPREDARPGNPASRTAPPSQGDGLAGEQGPRQ